MLIRDWGLDSLVILKGDCNDFIVVFPGIPHLDSNCDSWTKLVQLFIAQPWQQMIFDSPNPVVRDPEELKGHHFDSNKSYVQLFAQRTWSTEIPWAFSIFTTNNLLYIFFNNHGVVLQQHLQQPIYFSPSVAKVSCTFSSRYSKQIQWNQHQQWSL